MNAFANWYILAFFFVIKNLLKTRWVITRHRNLLGHSVNPAKPDWCRPMKGNPDSWICEIFAWGIGIRTSFACGIRNPGLWNPEYSSRNPTKDWNPKSKFHWQRLESSTWNQESYGVESRIHDCLYRFPYMGQLVGYATTHRRTNHSKIHWKHYIFLHI